MSATNPRIAIIGGGPGGLTLGLLLHRRSIPFTIFELRQKPTDEELSKPSGMLDLHDESGIAAIKECGLHDEFEKLTGECTEADKVCDKDGNILHQDEGEYSHRPEISRHALTKLLVSHLPVKNIKWGYKLLSVTQTGNEITLDFGERGTETCDLVIGADGAWSRVRSLLAESKPKYEGRQCITLTIRNVTQKYPHLEKLVGPGSFSSLGNRHGVMSQRGPQDSARIYIFLSVDDERFAATAGIAEKPATSAKDILLNDDMLLGSFGPIIKKLVSVACDEEASDNPDDAIDVRPLYVLPVDHSWKHNSSATVIGDAAHLMGPWAGEGVNLAMWDSLLLAHAITKAYEATTGNDTGIFISALQTPLREFEVDMWSRAKEKAEESASNGNMLFCEDGANAFANFFKSFMPPSQ